MYKISVYVDKPRVAIVLASQNEENLLKARELRNAYIEDLIEDGETETDYVPNEKEDLIFFTNSIIVELEENDA